MREVWALSGTWQTAAQAYQVNLESWESLCISLPVILLMKKRKGVTELFWHFQSFDKMSCNRWGWGFAGHFFVQRPRPSGAECAAASQELASEIFLLPALQAGSGPITCIHTYLYKYIHCRVIFGPCRAAPSKTYARIVIRKHRKSPKTTSAHNPHLRHTIKQGLV